MKPWLRALLLIAGSSLLLGSDCMFGRPIVDDRSRYYPSDGVIECSGTRCADLPVYELSVPPALDESPCDADLPSEELETALATTAMVAGMRLTVSAERPRDLNLGAVQLSDACVVVSGPVRLTIGTGSKLTRVAILLGPAVGEDSHASVRPAGRATPDLYLRQAQLEQVSLRASGEGAPSGSAQIEFGTCSQCETQLDSLDVIESQVQNSRLGADSLTMVGGAFDTVEIAFEYGLLAGVLANDLRTTACKALSLVGASIAGRASKIGPCDCGLTPATEMKDAGAAGSERTGDASVLPGRPGADAAPPPVPFGASVIDASQPDAGPAEAGVGDAQHVDGQLPEAGAVDAGVVDAQLPDAGAADALASDAAPADASADAAELDASEGEARQGASGLAGEACLGATISQSTLYGGMVDGKVRAENSTFRSVLFARHTDTALDMWSTNIELSVTCDHHINIRLDKTSGIGCSSCDMDQTALVCRLDREPKLTVNKCPSFRDGLRACPAPLPTRRSPPIPMPPMLGR